VADALEKLEAAVKKLAADMAELRAGQDELREGQAELREGQAELREGQAELREDVDGLHESVAETLAAVKNIQRTRTALTSAMTSAIKELSTSRSLDLRVKRLEDAVFGSKH
jgi:uncharacterized coiled-coil DUF342 family protein